MSKRTSISLIIADTAFHELARLAVERTLRNIDISEIIVISDNEYLIPNTKHIKISPFTTKEAYNKLIIERLANQINSDYGLIIQYDGFALDRQRWNPQFFDYDYIGAPWPNFSFHNVGNGGFSLRSKRLIEKVAELAELRANDEPEDIFIGRTIRPILEGQKKIKFAPRDLALQFSFESPGHPKSAFGFHGVLNLAIAYQKQIKAFVDAAPTQLLSQRLNEIMFGSLFISETERIELICRIKAKLHTNQR